MAEVYEHVTTSHLDELATTMTANHPNCASVRYFFFPDYVSFFFFVCMFQLYFTVISTVSMGLIIEDKRVCFAL